MVETVSTVRAGARTPFLPRTASTDWETATASALMEDMGNIFRQLRLKSCRAALVKMGSMEFEGIWALSDHGGSREEDSDLPLDSHFPGALSTITQLSQAGANETVVKRLSPRHWSCAWRVDADHVVVAEARYADARVTLAELDIALVRLVCDTGIRNGLVDADADTDEAGSMVWPQPQDRRKRRRRPQLNLHWSPVLTVASGLLALWIALSALPDALAASARLQTIVDKTMVQHLSVAMATGDYGEVQHALSAFEGLGYFRSAAVTNVGQKLVSMAGPVGGLRIGDVAPASTLDSAQALDLSMGSEKYGQLWLLQAAPGAASESSLVTLRSMALAAFAAAMAATGLLLFRRRRARRNGD